MESKIKFITDENQEVEMFVIEEAKLNGNTYLLVSESEEDDGVGYIMKQVEGDNSDVSYVIVEDDREIDAVADLFEELLDGEIDLIPEDEEQ